MDSPTWVGITSIAAAALCMCMGAVGPALGEARALAQALSSIAQQPDEAGSISRTLFIGLAMIESIAIYCFVISIILIFANPFWNHAIGTAVGGRGPSI
jgi:F-type H+-transporting ATPase subunit c